MTKDLLSFCTAFSEAIGNELLRNKEKYFVHWFERGTQLYKIQIKVTRVEHTKK